MFYSRLLYLLSPFGIALILTACTDPTETYRTAAPPSASKYTSGYASKIAYKCKTATFDSTGRKWTYHIPQIMNLLDHVVIRVNASVESNPRQAFQVSEQVLNKTNTDEFSNEMLTVRLQNKANGQKSVSVSHKTKSDLSARAESGFCTSSYIDTATPQVQDNTRFKHIIGNWKVDPSFSGSHDQHYMQLSLPGNIPPGGKHVLTGMMTVQSTCNALMDLGVHDFIAENGQQYRRGKAFALLTFYQVVNFIVQVYSAFRCVQDPNTLREVTKLVRWYTEPTPNYDIPSWFQDVCVSRQGSYPMYGRLTADTNWDGNYVCLNYFHDSSALEVLLGGTQENQTGEWIRYFKN